MDAITKPKRKASLAPSRSYPDLHDHISALDKAGLLIKVGRPINSHRLLNASDLVSV
jgi:hypothetical protein